MAFNSGKVYTIQTPRRSVEQQTPPSSPRPSESTEAARTTDSWTRRPTTRNAYVIGPVARMLTADGTRRIVWALLGPGAICVGVALCIFGSALRAWFDSVPYGDLMWVVLETVVITSIVGTWAAAIGSARQVRPIRTSARASWVLSAPAATFAGLLLPGLGLMMAGKRKLAAVAFWTLAPLTSAALVLGQWRWVVGRSSSPVPAALSGTAGEIALGLAFVVLVLSLLAWIVQALDGARRVSWGRIGRPGAVSFALVLSLAVFAATFRSHTVARNLAWTASALQAEGLRLLPWGLYEVAARLDPLSPRHQVRTAELATELGMHELAAARWARLETESAEWNAVQQALPGHRPEVVAASVQGP